MRLGPTLDRLVDALKHLEAQNFLLYDLYTPEGFVNEDVYAYSNGAGWERALIVYHNRYAEARGWIRTSAAFAVKTGEGDEKVLEHRTLGEGLGLRDYPSCFVIFREHISGLEYIRNCQELAQQGLYIELAAYTCRVFLDFRQVQDDHEQSYARLAARLEGAGVPRIDTALREMALEPLLIPFRELVNPGMFTWLIQAELQRWFKDRRPLPGLTLRRRRPRGGHL